MAHYILPRCRACLSKSGWLTSYAEKSADTIVKGTYLRLWRRHISRYPEGVHVRRLGHILSKRVIGEHAS